MLHRDRAGGGVNNWINKQTNKHVQTCFQQSGWKNFNDIFRLKAQTQWNMVILCLLCVKQNFISTLCLERVLLCWIWRHSPTEKQEDRWRTRWAEVDVQLSSQHSFGLQPEALENQEREPMLCIAQALTRNHAKKETACMRLTVHTITDTTVMFEPFWPHQKRDN